MPTFWRLWSSAASSLSFWEFMRGESNATASFTVVSSRLLPCPFCRLSIYADGPDRKDRNLALSLLSVLCEGLGTVIPIRSTLSFSRTQLADLLYSLRGMHSRLFPPKKSATEEIVLDCKHLRPVPADGRQWPRPLPGLSHVRPVPYIQPSPPSGHSWSGQPGTAVIRFQGTFC